jgi:hypothetical protein
MTHRKLMTAAAALLFVLLASAAPASAAQDCTPDRIDTLTQELMDMLTDNPSAGDHLDAELARVEQEYGGEPSDEQACEAFEKVIEALKQY